MANKQTTAMSELISQIDSIKRDAPDTFLFNLKKIATSLLAKEKDQIKRAFDDGQNGEFYPPENYFNETFQQ